MVVTLKDGSFIEGTWPWILLRAAIMTDDIALLCSYVLKSHAKGPELSGH